MNYRSFLIAKWRKKAELNTADRFSNMVDNNYDLAEYSQQLRVFMINILPHILIVVLFQYKP